MKKNYILAFTFLCFLIGQSSYAQLTGGDDVDGGELDEVCINCDQEPDSHDVCDQQSSSYDECKCSPSSCDSNDPCDYGSQAYDYNICYGNGDGGTNYDYCYYNPSGCYGNQDSGNPCDPSSTAYNPSQCGGDTGDPCDFYSYAYDFLKCFYWNTDEANDEDNPCSFNTLQAGMGASAFFENHVLELSNDFSPFSTTSGQNEEAFVIAEVNGVISSGIFDTNGGFTSGGIQTVSTNGGSIKISSHTIADVHTHPAGKIPRPSAEDLWSLADSKSSSPNLSDSYVIAADGTKYDLHISDVSKLENFKQLNGDFYDPVTKGFKDGTPLSIDYNQMIDSFTTNNHMSIGEARERAFAYVLKDAGIDLLKAATGSNEFKKIDVKPSKNSDGTEKKDAMGFTIYEKVDCL